jgi:ABC-type multidrug transport system fused ATPase/permease subunit
MTESQATNSPRPGYEERLAAASAGFARVDARWNLVANARLVAFVAAVVAAAWGLWGRASLGWLLAALFLALFVALAVYHARLGQQRARLATLRAMQEEALARIDRRWADLPLTWMPEVPADHPYAVDLDIVGRASLFQLLDTTATRMGRETLAAWLLAPADAATIRARQGAIVDLAPRLDLRQELELRGRAAVSDETDPEPFLAWAEAPHGFAHQRWLRWAAWLGPLAIAVLAVAEFAALIAYPLWAVPLLLNLAIGSTAGRRAYATIAAVAADHRAIAAYAGQLDLLATAAFTDPALSALQQRLGTRERAAPPMLRRLGRLAGMAIPPSSILYLPLQALFFWDLHVLLALERWKRQGGHDARRWLTTLGDAEALAALAGLQFDQPTWTLPAIPTDTDAYRATRLGHPLLRDDARVHNDVTIGPPGTFLLVTGSNMSGKSTLLRAIGVNTVLAQAGGPVCAGALALPPLALWTSVRVQDSLERGVSFFLAELQRLKLIVDAATRAHAHGGPRVLYLLDEILQGTNTAERSVAARRIIAYLVEQGAIGAVSTHDLALADDPRLLPAAVAVHFTDTVGESPDAPPMSFDYRLRPGVATTTNALRLMRLIGLELDEAPLSGTRPR